MARPRTHPFRIAAQVNEGEYAVIMEIVSENDGDGGVSEAMRECIRWAKIARYVYSTDDPEGIARRAVESFAGYQVDDQAVEQ